MNSNQKNIEHFINSNKQSGQFNINANPIKFESIQNTNKQTDKTNSLYEIINENNDNKPEESQSEASSLDSPLKIEPNQSRKISNSNITLQENKLNKLNSKGEILHTNDKESNDQNKPSINKINNLVKINNNSQPHPGSATKLFQLTHRKSKTSTHSHSSSASKLGHNPLSQSQKKIQKFQTQIKENDINNQSDTNNNNQINDEYNTMSNIRNYEHNCKASIIKNIINNSLDVNKKNYKYYKNDYDISKNNDKDNVTITKKIENSIVNNNYYKNYSVINNRKGYQNSLDILKYTKCGNKYKSNNNNINKCSNGGSANSPYKEKNSYFAINNNNNRKGLNSLNYLINTHYNYNNNSNTISVNNTVNNKLNSNRTNRNRNMQVNINNYFDTKTLDNVPKTCRTERASFYKNNNINNLFQENLNNIHNILSRRCINNNNNQDNLKSKTFYNSNNNSNLFLDSNRTRFNQDNKEDIINMNNSKGFVTSSHLTNELNKYELNQLNHKDINNNTLSLSLYKSNNSFSFPKQNKKSYPNSFIEYLDKTNDIVKDLTSNDSSKKIYLYNSISVKNRNIIRKINENTDSLSKNDKDNTKNNNENKEKEGNFAYRKNKLLERVMKSKEKNTFSLFNDNNINNKQSIPSKDNNSNDNIIVNNTINEELKKSERIKLNNIFQNSLRKLTNIKENNIKNSNNPNNSNNFINGKINDFENGLKKKKLYEANSQSRFIRNNNNYFSNDISKVGHKGINSFNSDFRANFNCLNGDEDSGRNNPFTSREIINSICIKIMLLLIKVIRIVRQDI